MPDFEGLQTLLLVLTYISFAFSLFMWGLFLYYILLSSFAWRQKPEIDAEKFEATKKFAMIIAAHNEEQVIMGPIRSLKQMTYPAELYDIFVIADNCTDNTAKIAREEGAIVYERTNDELRGKGFAMEWMFKKIFEMDTQYDAVCILDADNLVIQNFLTEMNKHLCLGHDAIQGYIDSKNPNDTWISGNNSIAFWIASRMVQLPRYTIGLSCVLGGTGLVISVPLLKELGWGATCLAEDLEFTLKMVQAGKKVAWSHAAKVFDEKPLDLKSSWNQRRRWMQGHFNCLFKFFKPLFKNAVKNRDFVSLDMCIYLSQPVIVALNGIGMVSGIFFLIVLAIIKGTSLIAMLFFLGTVLFLYIGIVFVLMEHKLTPTSFRYLLVMPFYNLTWVPIIIQGFLKRNENGWSHTEHTRGEISIDDIKK